MKYFAEGLPKKQINVLKALGPYMVSKGFYLAGGTALAIHLGHRISGFGLVYASVPGG
jgi:hypothetical protein